jgi:8-oxo-dGTP pyrophosphatase MutT (NUDIX family)
MNKACPVVLRIKENRLELLAFKRPTAGKQLVKGSLKKGESLENACVRELEEESGIRGRTVKRLGVWEANHKKQTWGFCLMHFEESLPDRWSYDTKDDGGQRFRFFWQPFDRPIDAGWDDVHANAFEHIKRAFLPSIIDG